MVKMGTVWDRTAEFFNDNIAAVLPVALLAFFVPTSIEGNFQAAMHGASTGLVALLYAIQLAFALLSLWGSLAIVALALGGVDAQAAGRVALARLPAALLVAVALFVATLVALLPVPAVLAASGVDLAAIARGGHFELGRGLSAFLALYMLAFLVVAIWLMARLSVVNPVIVRERRMFDALGQSWRLTRGVALRIVGVFLLFVLVAWVSVLAAGTVFGSVFALVAGGETDGVTLAGVLTSIVVAAVQTAFTVLIPAFTAKLYLALAARAGLREGAAAA